MKITLTYFPIEGAAEKVRLALAMTGTDFEDIRIKFPEWQELKPTTKYGQLPIMNIDGKEIAQSPAMLRWCGRTLGDGSLYPQDPESLMQIEEVLGLSDDIARAWSPCLYMAMRPEKFGYPADIAAEEKTTKVKALRESFLKDELPNFMKYLTGHLEASGAFFCGSAPTIADLQILPQLRYFTKGVADFVPGDCLSPYPVVTQWIERMMAIPQVKSWYEAHP
eukprot:gene20050-24002_t